MVFVDTSFLDAVANDRETRHADAVSILRGLEDVDLVTTTQVLGESWTLARKRLGHHAASGLIEGVRRSRLYTITHATADTEERAFRWLLRHDEREYSFVDAVSFETMREQRIDLAMTFDADFEAAGFQVLRA